MTTLLFSIIFTECTEEYFDGDANRNQGEVFLLDLLQFGIDRW